VGWFCGLFVLCGFYPLAKAWAAARGSTIRHPLAWAMAAWGAWCLAAWPSGAWLHWLALSLTACAGVAVLNARRPHAVAWHFVVGGLLLLLLRPFWEGWGELRLGGLYVTALAVGLGVAVGNHLPTRLGLPALIVGVAGGLDLARLTEVIALPEWVSCALLAVVPWLGWLLIRRRAATAFDQTWLTFRDRFGFGWAALTRELFNNAARNAHWGATLHWSGLRGDVDESQALAMLRALVQRFENFRVEENLTTESQRTQREENTEKTED
jgi:hypothetical protein